MVTERMALGLAAETAVAEHLTGAGFEILDRNWRRPWGELDIVARKNHIVHFVEVKASRKQVAGFDPFLRANGWKMHKIKRTAQTWLSYRDCSPDTEWQMDIASVIMDPSLSGPHIEIFENV